MTDDEVRQLYRCLLGREPENADTVAEFKRYYPTVERGRRAMLVSSEFEASFGRVTGRTPQTRDNPAATLALALLARAASAMPAPAARAARDPALQQGMLHVFPRAGGPRFGVVVGDPSATALEDLLPFAHPEAAILHVAPGFPPAVPLTGALADGTAVFRLGGDAASVAEILRQFARPFDVLCLLGPPAGPDWVAALRPYCAARSLVVAAGPDADAIGAAIADARLAEPVQLWHGLDLHHVGAWLLPVTYAPPGTEAAEPDLEAYPALAVATIVRDEAVCVENMLRSARPVASFYAVLDTGSSDTTPALAQAFLAGCGVPFAFAQRDHAAFADDFAAMRNAALAMVPDWIEWVLMLDADEELVPEDAPALLELIAGRTHEAYALPRYNFPGSDKRGTMLSYPDRQVRLLRHTPDGRIGYSGAVHETVRGVDAGQPPLDSSAMGGTRGGPHIHHLVRRFRTPEQEERKQAFYREIAGRRAVPGA